MEGGGEGRTRKGPKVPWFQDHKNPRFQGSKVRSKSTFLLLYVLP